MIINTSIFKKLIKEAYTGSGLNIKHDKDDIYIWGSYWCVKTKDRFFTKKEKAAVIELAGDIPQEGIIRAHKKEELEPLECNIFETAISSEPKTMFYPSGIQIEEGMTQKSKLYVDDVGAIVAVTDWLANLADESAKTEDDFDIEGPYQVEGYPWLMLWGNNTTTVAVGVRDWKDNEKLQVLKVALENLGVDVLMRV